MREACVSRQQLIHRLHDGLACIDYVRAAWLGGSDASGRTDQWSDIDLVMVVEEGRWEDALAAARGIAQTLGPIALSWRVPEPAWHGHHQEFMRVEGAQPFHDLDIVVMEKGASVRFLEPERHGEAVVLFDRDGLVTPAPFDRRAHEERLAARLEMLRQQFPMLQVLVSRAVLRRMPAEAAALYQRVTLAPLIELLRMRHAPERYDFGPRYLDRDLPPGLRDALEALALPADLEQLEAMQREAVTLFETTLADLDAGKWGPGPT